MRDTTTDRLTACRKLIGAFAPDPGNLFRATQAAEHCARANGFSVGALQRDSPRGLMFGDYWVAKWRNLTQEERDSLHGVILARGDAREVWIDDETEHSGRRCPLDPE